MIALVEGRIRLIRNEALIVEAAGLGYEVIVSRPESYTLNQEVTLWTYQQIREDASVLYGFETTGEYDLFCSLINVRGIGCKSAMNMLSRAGAAEICQAIADSDVKFLQKLPGIGSKSASQIILDLKGKIVLPQSEESRSASVSNPVWNDVHDALISLGFKDSLISLIEPAFINETSMNVDTMLRRALKELAQYNGI